MSGLQMRRLGLMMEPEPGNALEVEGVLNPAAVRGPDGNLYLFPRLVAAHNYSRIGIARVKFDQAGDPTGVERLGIALEPEEDYERSGTGGGCEDARVTFVEPLGHYVMTYTALSSRGPRIALAISEDLFHWQRLGLATFEPYRDIEFDGVDNKDASIFPVAVPDPSGRPSLALLHRPLFPGTRPEEKAADAAATLASRAGTELEGVPEVLTDDDIHRESIWISYRAMEVDRSDAEQLRHFTSHHRLAAPEADWERLKIGCGPPPVLTRYGWMMIYHGVSDLSEPGAERPHYRYSAGLMILSKDRPSVIQYRSPEPILTPELPEERQGIIADVVFPTGIDRRDDLSDPDRLDVYYGMADDRVGVARLDVPKELP